MRFFIGVSAWIYSALFCYGQDGFIGGQPRLAYWQIGDQKETVIVLHGGAGAPHQYLRPEFDALTQTATVIYYDQRGCGKSDTATSYIWQEHVADLKRLIRSLATNQQVFLAGSSWGSMLATLYAYTYPEDVKGLILTGTMPWYGDEQNYKRQGYSPTKVVRGIMSEKRIIIRQTVTGQAKQDTVEVSKRFECYSGLPQIEPLMSRISAPKAERLKQIYVPILLFHGTYNRRWDWAEEYAKLFPNIKVHMLSETGHDSWFGDPVSFFSISNDFIRNTSK